MAAIAGGGEHTIAIRPNTSPTLSFPSEIGYGTDGVNPDSGTASTSFTFRVVYTDPDNDPPNSPYIHIDDNATGVSMTLDTTVSDPILYDGYYTNGEQYIYITTLGIGNHGYYFTASDEIDTARLPSSGTLSGPTVSDLTITTTSLPNGTVGIAYNATLSASGGTPPSTWSISSGLPPGLLLNSSTGIVSGTPTTQGTYGFTAYVTDTNSFTYSKALSITIVAPEICDGIDNDNDGQIDEGFPNTDGDAQADCVDTDDDNDGYSDTTEIAAGSDPLNAASTPEVCDGIDNDLDGQIDEGLLNTYYRDADGDTYGNASVTTQACTQPLGYVSNSSDCDDGNVSINPVATEVCNGVDDNCNGQTDEGVQNTYYRDVDNDTYGNASITTQACTQPSGYVSNSSDCNDGNASINPGATEACNSIDDNCNTQVDEGCPGVTDNTPPGTDVVVSPDTDVTLTFDNVTTSGTTAVTTSGTGQPPPSGFRLGGPPIYYDITTTATYSGPIQVCFSYDETQFATERSLRLFHLEGGAWVDITDPGYPDTTNNIICGTTNSLSPFIIAEELSTAVTLQNISAHLEGDQVTLSWSTSFEIDNEGFIILRGESPGGPFTPITQGMIPAMGGGFKAAYTFTDGNVETGKTYYYRLQDIDSRGRVTAHQVIPVTVDVVRKGETPQGTTGLGNNMGSVSQQSGTVMDKDTVENEIHKPDSSTTWLSVVIPDNESKSSGVETDLHPAMSSIEDATSGNKVYTGNALTDAKEATGNIETHKQPLIESQSNESEPPNLSSGTSTFSVSIEDDKGNIIVVSKIEDTAGIATQTSGIGFTKESGQDSRTSGQWDRPEGLSLQVKEESGRIVLTWEGRGGAKGFILHRTEKGKDNYTAITSLIPYFGRDDKDAFLYRFTDNSAKPGVQYEYRLERVSPEFKMGRRN